MMVSKQKPQIILLNGASSSGKSSIAKALQNMLTPTYLYLGIDTFGDIFPDNYIDIENEKLKKTRQNEILATMLNCIHFLVESGTNLIVDHVIDEPNHMKIIVNKLSCFNVKFIAVNCPLDLLEKREVTRGDRRAGLAQSQYKNVHKGKMYDFEINTKQLTPNECALKIVKYIEINNLAISAFSKMNDGEYDFS